MSDSDGDGGGIVDRAELDKLRELADELGFWPATTNPEDIERHRRLNVAAANSPTHEQEVKRWQHLTIQAERRRNEERQRAEVADLYE